MCSQQLPWQRKELRLFFHTTLATVSRLLPAHDRSLHPPEEQISMEEGEGGVWSPPEHHGAGVQAGEETVSEIRASRLR